jgi:hypothetical protein
MEASLASLPRSDGVACFTRLYLEVTKGVQQELVGVTFEDPRFLARLDVVFASLFFSAIDGTLHNPESVPPAWAPLVEARGRFQISGSVPETPTTAAFWCGGARL